MEEKTHKISVLVRNVFGTLTRISALFSSRGFNIDSLSVATSQNDETSKMTIVTHGDEATIEQIEKQLSKLVDVIKVTALNGTNFAAREILMVKVSTDASTRSEIMQICDIFDACIVSIHESSLIVKSSGKPEKNDAFLKLIRPYGVIEIARSGAIAMIRSDEPTQSF